MHSLLPVTPPATPGKAAKKLAKAKNGDKYLSDDDSYSHGSSKSGSYSHPAATSGQEQPEQVSSQSLVQPEQASPQATYTPKPYIDAPYANTPSYKTPGKPYTDGPGAYPKPGSYSTYEAETPGYNPKDKEGKELHHTGGCKTVGGFSACWCDPCLPTGCTHTAQDTPHDTAALLSIRALAPVATSCHSHLA